MSQRGTLPSRFNNFKVPFGPIGETVFKRTYSHLKADGKPETWPDAAVRVVDGNLGLVDEKFIEPDERDKLLDLLLPFGILPAGRHLNASGIKGRQFLFNCHASGWDYEQPQAHFEFLFDELMQGGGVGANYSNRYLDKMPEIKTSIDLHIICREDHPNHSEFSDLLSSHSSYEYPCKIFNVEDSREGWVTAVDFLMTRAFHPEAGEESLVIDVSDIRAKGAPLKTSGGIACGPGPLVKMLTDLTRHLNGCIGRKLSSLDCMQLDHILASCVVAGGKRRSSRMSVKNWKDHDIFEFINCKREDGAHWTTNISVEIDTEFFDAYETYEPHARAVMRAVVLGKRLNGEPGFWNRSLAMIGEREPDKMYCPNPCGEIGLHMWENCNLGHVNLEYFANRPKAEMKEAFRLMTRWLVRATFGDIPQKRQREVVDRNRRIGVGFFGYHGWIALQGIKYSESWNNNLVQDTLMEMHGVVKEEGPRYCNQLGIPIPIANTTLAPTGSTAGGLVGTTTSAQAMIAIWYKRLVRYSDMDPELAVKKAEGYEVFKDPDAQNTEIVVFWCEDPLVGKVKNAGFDPAVVLESQYDIDFETSLKVQEMLQTIYADNAISFTINMKENQLPSEEAMEEQLFKHLPHLKGTTVFVEKSRKNMPIQPVTKAEFDAHTGMKQVTIIEDECKNGCPIEPRRRIDDRPRRAES